MHMNACMQLHKLPCSYISLHAGPWAFFVWAAHKNFAVLVTLQRLPKAAKTSIVSSKLGCLILIFYLDAIASVGLPTTRQNRSSSCCPLIDVTLFCQISANLNVLKFNIQTSDIIFADQQEDMMTNQRTLWPIWGHNDQSEGKTRWPIRGYDDQLGDIVIN